MAQLSWPQAEVARCDQVRRFFFQLDRRRQLLVLYKWPGRGCAGCAAERTDVEGEAKPLTRGGCMELYRREGADEEQIRLSMC